MRKKKGGDASFLIGLVLGIAIGAAVALVLTPNSGEGNRARLMGSVGEAKDALQSKAGDAKARVLGASEGAARVGCPVICMRGTASRRAPGHLTMKNRGLTAISIRYFIFTMLLLVTLLAACDSATPTLPPDSPPVGDSVRIGLVFDVAGSNAAQGVEQKAAAQLAVDEINTAGLEPHLVPVFEAGDGSEQTAMSAFQSLINIELALVIIGPT